MQVHALGQAPKEGRLHVWLNAWEIVPIDLPFVLACYHGADSRRIA
jgi:hypothetical protein